jgi:hypothetical protein
MELLFRFGITDLVHLKTCCLIFFNPSSGWKKRGIARQVGTGLGLPSLIGLFGYMAEKS